MSSGRLVPLTAAAGLLAPAAAASAQPVDVVPAHAAVPTHTAGSAIAPAPPEAGAAPVVHDDGGAGTATVVAVAGGTLLLGAATGFGAGGVLTRRRALGH